MNEIKIKKSQPPENASLAKLIQFILDKGLGLPEVNNNNGKVNQWTRPDFADAIGRTEVSVSNWLSGKGMKPVNEIRILNLLAGDDKNYRELWFLAFEDARISHNLLKRERNRKKLELRKRQKGPYIENIRFCLPNENSFNKNKGKCKRHNVSFPIGTKKVLISFDIKNADYGTPFIRKWYKDGERFKNLTDRYDKVWPGWTYLSNWKGLSPGIYSLRLFIGDKDYDANFRIG